MAVRAIFLVTVIVALLSAVACGSASEQAPTPSGVFQDAARPKEGDTSYYSSNDTTTDRLIVRTVTMSLLVKDVSGTIDSIAKMARDMGGFVVSSQITGQEDSRYGVISIRVPAEQTDAALAQLRSQAVRVETERTSSQDVTEEYVDLQSRLKNLEATEQQYLDLMKRAQTVDDTLKVQQQLTSTQSQIEQIKGKMQYLEQTSATSLITAELRPATSPKALVEPGWNPTEVAKSSIRGLLKFGQGLVNVAIVLGIFAPIWVPLTVAGWFGMRLLLKWSRVPPRS